MTGAELALSVDRDNPRETGSRGFRGRWRDLTDGAGDVLGFRSVVSGCLAQRHKTKLPDSRQEGSMHQQDGYLRLIDPAWRVVDGNEHVGVSTAVGVSRIVQRQCWPVTSNADLAVDRCPRNHGPMIAIRRPLGETHNHGAFWD